MFTVSVNRVPGLESWDHILEQIVLEIGKSRCAGEDVAFGVDLGYFRLGLMEDTDLKSLTYGVEGVCAGHKVLQKTDSNVTV
jgi:hypothetical protein